MNLDIPYLISNLTVAEKAGLCSGSDFWHTKTVERLGLPAVMVSDGPHGIRKQSENADHMGFNSSVPAVCFPAGCAVASSYDRSLINHMGQLLGEEARAEKVHTLLGPAINIKRSPLCGRNFEYLSEDPYLAGELSSSYVKGVQSKNVGVSVKHYAANNQEYRRMSVDTLVDERTLREIYLRAFEKTVREAKPWTLMCAYNLLNGTYCCENSWLLTEILRNEWGFDGIVMTDWGAMNNRVDAIKAGLDLEMPSSGGVNDTHIVNAIESGNLDIAVLDKTVENLLRWIERGLNEEPAVQSYDKDLHHQESRKLASQCAVLLKNADNLLPLAKNQKIAFIGTFAKNPRFQGGGSSHINSFKTTCAIEAANGLSVEYAPGIEDDGITANPQKLADAVAIAQTAEVAVLFVGLPDSFESEGYDRKHMDMPMAQNELISAVAAVQPNTVVVLHKGSPVTMPWLGQVKAVLDMYLGGQAVGAATVDLLFGDVNPSGKLAETFPLRVADTPCYLQFPGDGKSVSYGEGVYVGYRWYDRREMDVLFPFGYGLSYTNFSISSVIADTTKLGAKDLLTVTAKVKNTGSVPGAEVVQLYVSPPEKDLSIRPLRELKGFEKTYLAPGEEKIVKFTLSTDAFSYYNVELASWYAPKGEYEICVGNSSRCIAETIKVTVDTPPPKLIYKDTTVLGDLMEHGKADLVHSLISKMSKSLGGDKADTNPAGGAVISNDMLLAMMEGMPLHSISSFVQFSSDELNTIIHKINE